MAFDKKEKEVLKQGVGKLIREHKLLIRDLQRNIKPDFFPSSIQLITKQQQKHRESIRKLEDLIVKVDNKVTYCCEGACSCCIKDPWNE